MALHIVRSLGQAFEVCHKLNPRPVKKTSEEEEAAKSEQGGGKAGEEDKDTTAKAMQSTSSNDKVPDGTESTLPTAPIHNEDGAPSDFTKDFLGFDPFSPLFPNDVSNGNAVPISATSSVPLQSYASRPRPRPAAQQVGVKGCGIHITMTTSLDYPRESIY